MDLQELISRGRFIFAGASQRLALYRLVDGRRTAKDLANATRRHINNVHRDLRRLADIGLIEEKKRNGRSIDKDGFTLYEKTPLARTVPIAYFSGLNKTVARRGKTVRLRSSRATKGRGPQALPVPSETEILDICKDGEDQTFEFKAAGTETKKISREIAAMLNTKQGGIVLYGVDDDGTIQGTDISRQKFDQPLQNSVRHSIAPAAIVSLKSISALGTEILAIIVPPWNRRDVYQFEERVLVRKGTNVFAARPEELRKLHKGEYVV